MSWAFEFAFARKSSCRHLYHRNLLGVPDPSFRFYPHHLWHSLHCRLEWVIPAPIDGAVHCLAEWLNKGPSQVYEPKNFIKVSSEHTHIDSPSRQNSLSTDVNDLITTVAASDIAETIKTEPLTSPLFTQETEVSPNSFGVFDFQQAAASGSQPCGESLANAEFWEFVQAGAGYWVIPCVERSLLEEKGSWVRKCVIFPTWARKNSVWEEEPSRIPWKGSRKSSLTWMGSSQKISWGWGGNGQKNLGTKMCWYCSIETNNNLNHKEWSCIRQFLGLIKLKKENS